MHNAFAFFFFKSVIVFILFLLRNISVKFKRVYIVQMLIKSQSLFMVRVPQQNQEKETVMELERQITLRVNLANGKVGLNEIV